MSSWLRVATLALVMRAPLVVVAGAPSSRSAAMPAAAAAPASPTKRTTGARWTWILIAAVLVSLAFALGAFFGGPAIRDAAGFGAAR